MKKASVFASLLGGVLMSGLCGFPQNISAAEMKVGVVDFQRAINETEAGKKAERALNTALAEKKKKFDILKTELETLRQDFEKQRLVLSGKALEEKRNALQQKLMAVEQTGASYEQELAGQKAQSLKKILDGLQTVVQGIGKNDGFTFIFEKSQGGVLFTAGAQDITDRVIQEYNKSASQ